MPANRRATLWRQSFPFSCGPAALGTLLSSLGWTPAEERLYEEIAIWRESTAVACPGSHPFGLALAAMRRGFAAEVDATGPRPWLWPHIHHGHAVPDVGGYAALERYLARECQERGVPLRWPGRGPAERSSGLLLVSARERPEASEDPHWIGLLTTSRGLWVADPLHRYLFRSARSLVDWWKDSGYKGTRTWIAINGRTDGSTRIAHLLSRARYARRPARPARAGS